MFHFNHISTSLNLAQLSEIRRKSPTCRFSLERKEDWNVCPMIQLFRHLHNGTVFVSPASEHWQRDNLLWLAVGRRQEESSVSCCSNRVLHTILIQKPAHLDVIRGKHPGCGFYFGRERENSNVCLTFQIFRGLIEGFISVSPQSVDRTSKCWMPGSHPEQESSVVPCSPREHS